MLRKCAQLLGWILIATGFCVGVLDGTRSIADNAVELTPLGASGFWLLPKYFAMLEPAITRNIHPLLWDPLLINILLLPTVVVLFVGGTMLLIAGKGKSDVVALPDQMPVR